MSTYYNPHAARCGIHLEPWLLSRKKVSAEAKIVYGELASGAQGDGRTLIKLSALWRELGLSEPTVRARLDELRALGLIEVSWSPGGYVRCRFRAHRWITPVFFDDAGATASEEDDGNESGDDEEGRGGTTLLRARRLHPADEPVRSRYSFEECVRFTTWRSEQGESVRNVYGLARHIHHKGYRDQEIADYLAREPEPEQIADPNPPDPPGNDESAVM